MINSEKAFDILPYVSDIYEKLDVNKYISLKRAEVKSGNKDKSNALGYGLDIVGYVFKQSPKIKEEFFSIVSIMEEKSIDEIKSQPLTDTLNTIKTLFEDVEAMDFFKQAME